MYPSDPFVPHNSSHPSKSDAAARLKARRPKPQLSCVPCKAKKQKCDRGHPCKNCSKSAPTKCVYVDHAVPRESLGRSTSDRSSGSSTQLRSRLQLLETRIAELTERATNLPPSYGNDAHPENELAALSPRLSETHREPHFIPASHWEGVLEDLEELKIELGPSDTSFSAGTEADLVGFSGLPRPQLLFVDVGTASKQEIIASLPTKVIINHMLDVFFLQNGVMPLISVLLHEQTFREECEHFWSSPQSVSLTWLSILCSIMTLSLQAEIRAGRNIDGILLMEATCVLLSRNAAICLKLADYARPTKYTVEAMTFSLASEHYWIEKEPYRASLMFSMIVRTAYRMGYHRDPRHYANMSPFEAEMQRRSWALITQMDLFLAGKCGLPPEVDQTQADTASPSNLLDMDLSRNMLEIPISRPDHERTTIGYLNYKTRLAKIHRRVIDRMNASSRLLYDDVMQLDAELVQQVNTRPPWLQPPDPSQLHTASIAQIGSIIDADLIVQRARMILHHKFIAAGRRLPKYAGSRKLALEAAKTALAYQDMLASFSGQPNAAKQSWRLSSLLAHDFLFAALILCMDMKQDLEQYGQPGMDDDIERAARIQEHLRYLRSSYMTWKDCLDISSAAQEAHEIVKAMLEKFADIISRRQPHSAQNNMPPSSILSSHDTSLQSQGDATRRDPVNSFATQHPTLSIITATDASHRTTAPPLVFDSFTSNLTMPSSTFSPDFDMTDAFSLGPEWPRFDFDVYGASMSML